MFQSISEQDRDNLSRWELDFPKTNSDFVPYSNFVPYLGTAIRIEKDGEISYKFYRKSQKKNITLHFKSHHTMKTKVEVVKNFYITAEKNSSSPELAEESKHIIDNLLRCNGYTDPRPFKDTHIRIPKTDIVNQEEKVCLKIPYVSEYVSYEILRYIRKRKLPISVIFIPGKKLREMFCTSRPLVLPPPAISVSV